MTNSARPAQFAEPGQGLVFGQRVLVADGAMGTMLQASDVSLDDFDGHDGCNEILNVTRPDVVSAVHQGYLAAGVDCITTNTFGANLGNLGEYGLAGRIGELSEDMAQVAGRLATAATLPLVIDSTEPEVIRTGLELLAGRAVVNSVNYEDGDGPGSRIERVMPMVAEHGAAVIALTIDEQGQARTADWKVAVATRLIEDLTGRWGMRTGDIIVDCLTFPIATGQQETRRDAIETIEAVRRVKQRYPGVQTTLGISNVSFGLNPAARAVLSSVFLDERATFLGQWGLRPSRGGGPSYDELAGTQGRPRLRMWLDRMQTEGLLTAGVVYGYYPAVSEGNDLIVLDEAGQQRARFSFPRQRRDRHLCLADFFRARGTGQPDVVAFQLVTVGSAVSEPTADLEDRAKVVQLLAPERIGVTLTEEFQLVPEQSTDALIAFHPEARYFSA
jgi:cobalamin-dependent methionine synthase I